MSGTAGTSKALTYRYFLKDKNTANTVETFQVGAITVTFTPGGFSTAEATNRRLVQTFTVSAAAPGGAGSTAPLKVGANGPLELLGPSISLADVGFDEGMLVLSIAIGVDRAKLIFGTGDSVTVDLLGVLGTFDLAVDAFGLLSGNVKRARKFGLRIASLEAHVPDVVDIFAEGIDIKYDPKGPRSQELLKINSATVFFPKLNVRGVIKPFDPNIGRNVEDTGQTSGVIPGLVVRLNGFTIGTAELGFGIDGPNVTP